MIKHTLGDLAVWGGAPMFAETLHVGRPNIGNRERLMERVTDMLDRRWLSNDGPYVRDLERRLADYLGVKHCIAMCNGTVALEIVIRALGLTGEVIVPSFTFIATAHALQWQEITPVFCDIDPEAHTLDPARVEMMITPRTTGIIGVHVWGKSCPVDELAEIAQRRNLRVIYDAAHALGCSYRGQMIGRFGDAEVFSFHATKFFNSFEGGAVTTNDDSLAEKVRFMRNFGFAGYDRVDYIGTNGKMTEICAAMGLTSFESLDEFIAVNARNYQIYRQHFAGLPGVRMVVYDEREKNNFQYVILEIDETVTGITRDQIVRVLHAEQVLARRYFYPGCHQMEPYRSYFPFAGLLLPVTERLTTRVMSLPTGTAVTAETAGQVADLVRFIIAHGPEIAQKLAD